MSAKTGCAAIHSWRAYGTIRASSRCWSQSRTGASKGPRPVRRIVDFRQAGSETVAGCRKDGTDLIAETNTGRNACATHAVKSQADMKHPCLWILVLILIPIAFTACTPAPGSAPILLFNGTGTSANDVAAVETVLNGNHLKYSTANSSQLNRMSESQIREYRLLIVPGGNFVDIGNSLTSSTTANI